MKQKPFRSALHVQDGIEQPPQVNPEVDVRLRKNRRKLPGKQELVDGVISGNISLLSQAITLIESTLPQHQLLAQEVLEGCLSFAGNSIRIGITGVPGVGKSTFIEALGLYVTGLGRKLAVLAIDPSSQRSKGSILGDKTRMEELSGIKGAYIRPSPSAGSLGGVARKTWETIVLCEAAGFEVIFIETVGVGQSETLVHSMSDYFLLLMLAGAGDELQGIKRGIMEMADSIVINKADGTNLRRAQMAAAEYSNALRLFPPSGSGVDPAVMLCSALEKTGIAEIWDMIANYCNVTRQSGYFERRRAEQSIRRLHESLRENLLADFYNAPGMNAAIARAESGIAANQISAYNAARSLIELWKENHIG